MNSDYLSEDGKSLTFESRSEFDSILGTLDLNVPSRISGRKSFHRERYCAIRYLKGAVYYNQINFPFSICKSERPDFIITFCNGETIGLEHSEITTKKWQQTLTQIARLLQQKQALFGNLPNDELKPDEAASKWVELALKAIEKKTEDLNKRDFKKLDSYELLLYSNTDLPNVEQNQIIPKLSEVFNKKFNSMNFSKFYSSISVVYGDELWLRTMQINNVNSVEH
ncbi:MAG: hypothetical protein L0Y80_06775 [Ignavibacteriae bacterium]|nr:hypothetical protein [Ignavibacteriota bacterium]